MLRSPEKKRQVLGMIENSHRLADECDFLTDDEEQNENSDPSLCLRSKVDCKLLKKNLWRLEAENNQLHNDVKNLEDKLTFSQNTSIELELKHGRELRNVQKCAQLKLEEREKLVSDLRIFIDRQQSQIHQLQEEHGEEVVFSVANSVNNFVNQISCLQDENVKLKEENVMTCSKIDDLKAEIETLNESIANDYVLLIDYQGLIKQNEILSRRRAPAKSSMAEARLKMEITSLQEQLENSNSQVRVMEKKNAELKKKVLKLESECTRYMFAPPEIHYRDVVDTDAERKLSLVEDENENLIQKFKSTEQQHKREIEKLEERIAVLEKNNKRLEERDEANLNACKDNMESVKTWISRFEKEKSKNNNFQSEFHRISEELEHYKKLRNERRVKETCELQEKYNQLQIDCLKKDDAFKQLVGSFRHLSLELRGFKECKDSVNGDLKFLNESLAESLTDVKTKVLSAVEETSHRSSLLSVCYKKEIQLRKKLHDQLLQLKGNIRVFCRVRPLIKEDGKDCSEVISFGDDDDSVISVTHKDATRCFKMDRVFQPTSTQQEVFEDVKSLVMSCLDGYNVCIFAYGQTGSGKTYTMEGTQSNPGLNQNALKYLFQYSQDMKDWNFTLLVSFVEIYNEMLRDLLSPEPTEKLVVKQQKDGLHIPGLTHVKVSSVDDVNELFSLGHVNRSTAPTGMNERSSRSHSVLTVTVVGQNTITKTQVTGKLNLVDLAGSERVGKSGSEGLRMKEAQNINKSLSALGDVIHALRNKSGHVPYRNTKLTYMLQDSLGGDSKTLMVVQVSPVDKNGGETMCSLNFAHRVRQVELGAATRKVKRIK